MSDLKHILDDNASATLVVQDGPADLAEYGRVSVRTDDVAATELMSYLAASVSGISMDLSAVSPSDIGRHLYQASLADSTKSDSLSAVVDPSILAMMHASEFYTLTEGDLWQFALIPLQLGFTQP